MRNDENDCPILFERFEVQDKIIPFNKKNKNFGITLVKKATIAVVVNEMMKYTDSNKEISYTF